MPSSRVCPAIVALLLTLIVPRQLTAEDTGSRGRNWIEREQIRAGWIYPSDGIEQIERFKRQGLNALITSASNPEQFDKWARESRRVGMHLFGVLGFSFDAERAGMRRAVFGNGYESVVACPTDERFWQQHMIDRTVALAKQGMTPEKEISGILIDFELYANSEKGGQIYYTDACYCDHCFRGFLASQKLEDAAGQVPYADRVKWLKDKGRFDAYHPFLQGLVREQAKRMREAVEKVRGDFFLGYYPRPHNWMLVGVAQGMSTPEHPMILWATDTYGGGGPKRVPAWQEEMHKQGISCYYCAGMLLRFYSAANLAANMVHTSRLGNGYWLFTVHTLCIPEDKQNGDYYLSAGTPEDYLAEIRRANQELDKYSADPAYKTALTVVEEPVRYRHVGYDVGRLKVPRLVDKSQGGRGKPSAIPPWALAGSQFLAVSLKPQEEAAIRFDVAKNRSGDVWGVSYAVVDPGKAVVASGRMPPGQETTVAWKAATGGVHTLVLTAGYYGRCTAVASSVPFALLTQGRLEVSQPGGKVFFYVPAGLEQFDVSAQCEWGTSGVKIAVYDPDGKPAAEGPTDPYLRNFKSSIPTQGKTGKLWRLDMERLPKTSFRSVMIRLDRRIPQYVTLSPEYRFDE